MDIFPLTEIQKGISFDCLSGEGLNYNVSATFEVDGLELDKLVQALNLLIAEEEALRVNFEFLNGEIICKVKSELYYYPEIVECDLKNFDDQIKTLALTELSLFESPLFAVKFVKTNEKTYMLIVLHHIISDGQSVNIFCNKLLKKYQSPNEAIKVNTYFRTFANEENSFLHSPKYNDQMEYWRQKLQSAYIPELRDYQSQYTKINEATEEISFEIPTWLRTRIKDISSDAASSEFMFHLANFAVLLKKLTHQNTIVFSSPFSQRNNLEAENTIGCFINTLPLRFNFSECSKFEDILDQARTEVISSIKNIRFSSNHIARNCLNVTERKDENISDGENSLFDILFVSDFYESDKAEGLSGLRYQHKKYDTISGNIAFVLCEIDGMQSIQIKFKPSKYSIGFIRKLGERYLNILQSAAQNPAAEVALFDCLTDDEHSILDKLNLGSVNQYEAQHLVEVFDCNRKKYQEQVLLMSESTGLSWNDVNKIAERIASDLLEFDTGQNVGIYLSNSIYITPAILGVLKSGLTFVPIDPRHPEKRNEHIFNDAQINTVVTLDAYSSDAFLNSYGINTVLVDGASISSKTYAPQNYDPEDTAYIIYTSGTTGVPKGVRIAHHSICNTLTHLEYNFPLAKEDVYLSKTPITFDVSMTELLGCFFGSGKLLVTEQSDLRDSNELIQIINKFGVTHMNMVPTMLGLFFDRFDTGLSNEVSSLKYLFVGGEAISFNQVNRFKELGITCQLINMYGPAEASVWCSFKNLSGSNSVNIGKPFGGALFYILDNELNQVPIGVTGELYISGPFLAQSYQGKTDLTEQKFLNNPFYKPEVHSKYHNKMYRTGDICRYNSDLDIEFFGRIDSQIKFHGIRFELAELDSLLRKHKSVEESYSMLMKADSGNLNLYSFVASKSKIDTEVLKDYLQAHLPHSLLPSFIYQFRELPRNTSNKVDINKLISLAKEKPVSNEALSLPNEIEAKLIEIWRANLGRAEISLDDNFFDLGGHSVSLIKVTYEISTHFDVELPITTMFENPSIRSLASLLLSKNGNSNAKAHATPRHKSEKKKKTSHDIAIVGMSVNVPGATELETFLKNIKENKVSIHQYTDDELRSLGVDEQTINDDKYIKVKGRIQGADCFDAGFFGYAPSDVNKMSPQLRVLYKSSVHALDDAGYNFSIGSNDLGIFVSASDDFLWYQRQFGNQDFDVSYDSFTKSTNHFMATRLAYSLNANGPAINVLTACSSSLSTVHSAIQSLILEECSTALAGGVTIELPLEGGYWHETGMMFSHDGICRPFDSKATGTVFSHGLGMVVLKRLSDAIEAKDDIYAVIKGSAINNDGSDKVGFLSPSIKGQQDVIKKSIAKSGICPTDIGYLEAHGTGTKLGDPIEIQAFANAIGLDNTEGLKCAIGSIKANIGHTDTAAGVVGLIKLALCLKNKILPGLANLETVNENLDLANGALYFNRETKFWEVESKRSRIGCVNSLGVGGTNVHMVLEEFKGYAVESSPLQQYVLFPFSAKSKVSLDGIAENTFNHLAANSHIDPLSAANTIAQHRSQFNFRKSIVLDSFSKGQVTNLNSSPISNFARPNKIYFLCSGQAALYSGMAKDLYLTTSSNLVVKKFKVIFDKVISNLSAEEQKFYRDMIFAGANPDTIFQTKHSQICTFLVNYSIAKLIMEFGVKPDGFIGHSLGEITASALAGSVSLKDCVAIIKARGEFMQHQPPGAMLAIMANSEQIAEDLPQDVYLCLVNSPKRCVVGGTSLAIEKYAETLRANNVRFSPLNSSHAFHTPLMDGAVSEFKSFLKNYTFRDPKIPIMSGVSGKWINGAGALTADYWASHIREPVRFDLCLAGVVQEENVAIVETGIGSPLMSLIRDHNEIADGLRMVNLIRNSREDKNDELYFMEKLGKLWEYGVELDWEKIFEFSGNKVHLPGYKFDESEYKIDVDLRAFIESASNGDKSLNIATTEAESHKLQKTDIAEGIVARSIQDVFGISSVTESDNFFDLGGDSLKAIALVNYLDRNFNIQANINQIFETPIVGELEGILISEIQEEASTNIQRVERAEEKAYYKLSAVQKRIYVDYVLNPKSLNHNLASASWIKGHLDRDRLIEAIRKLCERFEVLRTSFSLIKGEPVQILYDLLEPEIEFQDGTNGIKIGEVIADFVRPFELGSKQNFRVRLVKFSDEKTLFLFDVHHIICDGISVEILTHDLSALYNGVKLPPIEVQFKDYCEYEDGLEHNDAMVEAQEYWVGTLLEPLPKLTLESMVPHFDKGFYEYEGGRQYFEIDLDISKRVNKFAVEHSCSISSLMLTAWYTLISKYSEQNDIIIGIPMNGRNPSCENMVGMFVNTLPVRLNFSEDIELKEMIASVSENLLRAFSFQSFPIDKILSSKQFNSQLGRSQLFDVCFDFQNFETAELKLGDAVFEPIDFDTHISIYDLTLTCIQDDLKLTCFVDFAKKLFSEADIQNLTEHYKKTLIELISGEKNQLKDIDICSSIDLYFYNKLNSNYRNFEPNSIIKMFEENVAKNSDKTLLLNSYGDVCSYYGANSLINKVANTITQLGLDKGLPIILNVERGINLFIGLFGIIKSGHPYVPVDHDCPAARFDKIVKSTGAKVIVSDSDQILSEYTHVINIDEILRDKNISDQNPNIEINDNDIAYIIYTSGSTGEPKGIKIPHGAVRNFVNDSIDRQFFKESGDRIISVTNPSFDIFVFESIVPFCVNASIFVPRKTETIDPFLISRLIVEHNITHILSTVSRIRAFVQSKQFHPALMQLKSILTGGEIIDAAFVKYVKEVFNGDFYNLYGPSETTVWSTANKINGINTSVGRPISNTQIYILNKNDQLCPIGKKGQIAISGSGVFAGYIGDIDDDHTVQFSPYGLSEVNLYKTGDIGRLNKDLEIEVVGREGSQVKIRGYRVDLEEINKKILEYENVGEAVSRTVLTNGITSIQTFYSTIEKEQTVTDKDILEHLELHLPKYMIPSQLFQLSELPKSKNGKIDVKLINI